MEQVLAAGAKTRALHVFPNFDTGGSQMRFALLARALDASFTHSVITLNGRRGAAGLLPPELPIDIVVPPLLPRSPLVRLRRLQTLISEISPDILITYNWGTIEWTLAAARRTTPHIHFEDGFGPEEADGQLKRRVWTRRVALSRSTVVVPSLTLQKIAVAKWWVPPGNVKYIPNGIAPRDTRKSDFDLRTLGIDQTLPRIVWVGALRPEKNPLRLLRAFAPVKNHAVLIVIGDGPQGDAVRTEAERLSLGDHFHMIGHRTDARDIIMQCDIMALSSDTEQMPFSILEGMDAGLAIAAADVGDVRHIVSTRNHPFIVPRSQDALTGALHRLINDVDLRIAIGADNRKKLRQSYHIERMINAYRELFNRYATSNTGQDICHAWL
jgi:glycosyltransferase involved in cell wall biosynthesis